MLPISAYCLFSEKKLRCKRDNLHRICYLLTMISFVYATIVFIGYIEGLLDAYIKT
jgi:hypothetical protein